MNKTIEQNESESEETKASRGFWQAFVVARNDVFWDVASLRQMAGR